MPLFHHVNLGVPTGGIDLETEWLVDVLGYRKLESPEEFPTACWFECDDGTQVHLSQDPDHRPAARAHVALVIDDLAPICGRLEEREYDYQVAQRPDLTVLLCADPAGNRWELRSAISA